MTDEEQGNSRSGSLTEDDYEDGDDAYDDEGTLDEEEMLPGEGYQNELKMLEDDANLTVEELRRKYYSGITEEEDVSSEDAQSTSSFEEQQKSEEQETVATVNGAESAGPSSSAKDQRSRGYFSDDDDNEEDVDYLPPDPWRRNVRVGPLYQACVSETCEKVESSTAAGKHKQNERETPLWLPHTATRKVEEFLKCFFEKKLQCEEANNIVILPPKKSPLRPKDIPVRDNEDALKALLDANYNASLALSHFPFVSANPSIKTIGTNPSKWSDEDCDMFEHGLQLHGKNFYEIQRLLPHRTVGEIVSFYYIWKKTERHDIYQERARNTKQQMHSNSTDFMGSLIEHMDSATGTSSLELSSNSIPASLDSIAEKEWRECWQGTDNSTALPHLDNDTIANVLQ